MRIYLCPHFFSFHINFVDKNNLYVKMTDHATMVNLFDYDNLRRFLVDDKLTKLARIFSDLTLIFV